MTGGAPAGTAHAPGAPGRAVPIDPGLSTWLDLSRVVAALLVYVGHAVLLGVAPPELSMTWWRSADDAVIAFFVLSGFVIAVTTRDRHATPRDYALARLSRVYSVVVPALLVALAMDLAGRQLALDVYADFAWKYEAVWRQFVRHWLFLGEGWLGVAQPFTVAPYWSLTYEVWYYLLFGVCVFVPGRWRWIAVSAVLLAMGPWMLLLLPAWWLGVMLVGPLSRWRIARGAALVLMGACAAGYGLFLISGWRDALDRLSRSTYAWITQASGLSFTGGSTYHVFPDYVVALLFAGFLIGCAHLRTRWPLPVARAVRWLADHSFSFYLMHFPALMLARALGVHHGSGWANALVLLGTLVLTLAVAQVGERRRALYRQAFERLEAIALAVLARRPTATGGGRSRE